jgi:hypothetical protein
VIDDSACGLLLRKIIVRKRKRGPREQGVQKRMEVEQMKIGNRNE